MTLEHSLSSTNLLKVRWTHSSQVLLCDRGNPSSPIDTSPISSLSLLYNKGLAFFSQGAFGLGSKSLKSEVETDLGLGLFKGVVGVGLTIPGRLRDVRLPVTARARSLRGVEGEVEADRVVGAGVEREREAFLVGGNCADLDGDRLMLDGVEARESRSRERRRLAFACVELSG